MTTNLQVKHRVEITDEESLRQQLLLLMSRQHLGIRFKTTFSPTGVEAMESFLQLLATGIFEISPVDYARVVFAVNKGTWLNGSSDVDRTIVVRLSIHFTQQICSQIVSTLAWEAIEEITVYDE